MFVLIYKRIPSTFLSSQVDVVQPACHRWTAIGAFGGKMFPSYPKVDNVTSRHCRSSLATTTFLSLNVVFLRLDCRKTTSKDFHETQKETARNAYLNVNKQSEFRNGSCFRLVLANLNVPLPVLHSCVAVRQNLSNLRSNNTS